MPVLIQASRPEANVPPRVMNMEPFALDVNRCTCCQGTLIHIEKALTIICPVLEALNGQAKLRKVIIHSEEQTLRHRLTISPTVRVNGKDLPIETMESHCASCSELCGCAEGINCRVWPYRGKEDSEAPMGLILESLLGELGRSSRRAAGKPAPYRGLPENLQRFFRATRQPEWRLSAENETCYKPAVNLASGEPSWCETSGDRWADARRPEQA